LEGRVKINGQVVTSLGTVVAPGDDVRVGRKPVRPQSHTYILLNKPAGYLCTRSDEAGRKTIFDLVPPDLGRLFHVGRLDKESEGLILLTNDGDYSQQIAHPNREIEKEYEVVIDQPFDIAHTAKLLRGVTLESGRGRMHSVHALAPTKLKIVLREGLKRQIRDMLWKVGGYRVKKLVRVRIGGLRDPRLKTGYWRPLHREELNLILGEKPEPKAPRIPRSERGKPEAPPQVSG
jgi:23S rRNA pseudouridine2605 synthase